MGIGSRTLGGQEAPIVCRLQASGPGKPVFWTELSKSPRAGCARVWGQEREGSPAQAV